VKESRGLYSKKGRVNKRQEEKGDERDEGTGDGIA